MRAVLLSLVTVMLMNASAFAVVETYDFTDEADRDRYLHFTQVLRCPKCQNQNLADSNAPIAADLRRELHRLLEQGKSDEEISRFMVDRYGEYVLYDPPFEWRTALLWLAPAGLTIIGLGVLVSLVRRSRRRDDETDAQDHLSADEQARLQALLRDGGKD